MSRYEGGVVRWNPMTDKRVDRDNIKQTMEDIMEEVKALTQQCPQCKGFMYPTRVQGPYKDEADPYFVITWSCRDRQALACESGAITTTKFSKEIS